MFTSIRRGFGFLQQAVQMATKDPDLLKPSFYALAVNFLFTLVAGIPMLIVMFLLDNNDNNLLGLIFFLIGALFLFVQYAISYVFSGMTVKLVHDYLTEGDGRMDKAWANVKRDFFDILTLAAASAVVKLIENMLRGKNRRGQRNMLGEMAGGLLSTVWTVATYFVLPAMILEDLNLWQSLKRATQLVKNNLLLVAVTEIGVGGVVGFIGFLIVISTLALAGGGVYLVGSAAEWALTPTIIAAGVAILIAGVVIAITTALSSYVTTAYHTCMFLWATAVEKARAEGKADSSVAVPGPVAAVI